MFHEDNNLVLHIDADAFFASVEQLLIPPLRRRPVVVGSGCIASCSYEARRFGLHAGMSLARARRLCPEVVILAGQYQTYRCFAEQIWQICRLYTCGLETYLDEAYGDAAGMEAIHGDPLSLGRKLQRQVHSEVRLSVSIGLARNRVLAGIASHAGKPGGVVWIAPSREREFLDKLPAERLPGVGPKTAAKLHDMNVHTVGGLADLSREFLRSILGRRGEVLYERSHGRDFQALRPAARPKTISRETTFHKPTCDAHEIAGMLFYLTERAMRSVRAAGLLAGCVELNIRYDDWKEDAARRTLGEATADEDEVFAVVLRLLGQLHRRRVSLRHVGVVLSKFCAAGEAGRLFEPAERTRRRRLYRTIDTIRDRWGHGAIVRGRSIELLGKLRLGDYGFVLRTPSLTK